MKHIILLFLFAYTCNTLAGTCCHYSVTSEPLLFNWGNSNQLEIAQIGLRYTKSSNWFCLWVNCRKVYVDFDRGQSSSYDRIMRHNNTTIHYNIYKHSTLQTPLTLREDATNSNNYFKTRAKSNRPKRIKVYGKLPIPNQNSTFFPKGNYTDNVTLRIYPRYASQNEQSTATLPIKLYIPPVLELSLVDSGAPFDPNDTHQTLQFGELHQGDMQQFDIRVKSNAGYAISFSSQNNGKLKNIAHPDTISYQTKINGTTIDLANSNSSAVEVASQNGITPQSGATIHVAITIGNVTNKHFGQYQDTVTVTAMSLD